MDLERARLRYTNLFKDKDGKAFGRTQAEIVARRLVGYRKYLCSWVLTVALMGGDPFSRLLNLDVPAPLRTKLEAKWGAPLDWTPYQDAAVASQCHCVPTWEQPSSNNILPPRSPADIAKRMKRKEKFAKMPLVPEKLPKEPDLVALDPEAIKDYEFLDTTAEGFFKNGWCSEEMDWETARKSEAVSFAHVGRQTKPKSKKYPEGVKRRFLIDDRVVNSRVNDVEKPVQTGVAELSDGIVRAAVGDGSRSRFQSGKQTAQQIKERVRSAVTDETPLRERWRIENDVDIANSDFAREQADAGLIDLAWNIFSVDWENGYYQLTGDKPRWVGYFSIAKKRWVFRQFYSILFGSVTSVNIFTRTVRAMCWLGSRLAFTLADNYFDDVNGVELAATASSAVDTLVVLHAACGWVVHPREDAGENDCKTFAAVSGRILGLIWTLNKSELKLEMTPETRNKIVDLCEKLKGEYSFKLMEKLAGVLGFAKVASDLKATHMLVPIWKLLSGEYKLHDVNLNFILDTVLEMALGPSRAIPLRPTWVHVRTDASTVPENIATAGTVGGWHLNQAFSWMVDLAGSLMEEKFPNSLIFFLETLAVYVAVVCFGPKLQGKNVVFWIDNTSADFSLIKGGSPKCHTTSCLIALIHERCRLLHIFPYFEWLDSAANSMADFLSRETLETILKTIKDLNLNLSLLSIPKVKIFMDLSLRYALDGSALVQKAMKPKSSQGAPMPKKRRKK